MTKEAFTRVGGRRERPKESVKDTKNKNKGRDKATKRGSLVHFRTLAGADLPFGDIAAALAWAASVPTSEVQIVYRHKEGEFDIWRVGLVPRAKAETSSAWQGWLKSGLGLPKGCNGHEVVVLSQPMKGTGTTALAAPNKERADAQKMEVQPQQKGTAETSQTGTYNIEEVRQMVLMFSEKEVSKKDVIEAAALCKRKEEAQRLQEQAVQAAKDVKTLEASFLAGRRNDGKKEEEKNGATEEREKSQQPWPGAPNPERVNLVSIQQEQASQGNAVSDDEKLPPLERDPGYRAESENEGLPTDSQKETQPQHGGSASLEQEASGSPIGQQKKALSSAPGSAHQELAQNQGTKVAVDVVNGTTPLVTGAEYSVAGSAGAGGMQEVDIKKEVEPITEIDLLYGDHMALFGEYVLNHMTEFSMEQVGLIGHGLSGMVDVVSAEFERCGFSLSLKDKKELRALKSAAAILSLASAKADVGITSIYAGRKQEHTTEGAAIFVTIADLPGGRYVALAKRVGLGRMASVTLLSGTGGLGEAELMVQKGDKFGSRVFVVCKKSPKTSRHWCSTSDEGTPGEKREGFTYQVLSSKKSGDGHHISLALVRKKKEKEETEVVWVKIQPGVGGSEEFLEYALGLLDLGLQKK